MSESGSRGASEAQLFAEFKCAPAYRTTITSLPAPHAAPPAELPSPHPAAPGLSPPRSRSRSSGPCRRRVAARPCPSARLRLTPPLAVAPGPHRHRRGGHAAPGRLFLARLPRAAPPAPVLAQVLATAQNSTH